MVLRSESEQQCQLFGKFGILIQVILGFLSFSSLILKRYLDKNRRSWKVWSMDTSKQALGAGILHMINLTVAEAIGEMHNSSNKCTWYFLNFTIDTFLGIGICYLLLKGLEMWFNRFQDLAFQSGFYGDPPSWKSWSYQVWIWILIVILMKSACVFSVFLFNEPLGFIGDLLLAPFAINANLELVMVMIIIPVLCNSLVFWVTDSYLKFSVDKKVIPEGVYEDMEILEMNSYNINCSVLITYK